MLIKFCTGKGSSGLQLVLDLSVVLVIFLTGWIYTSGIESIIDISLYDESNYLHDGLLIPDRFPSAQNAPLYALWYYILSLVQHDTIGLYFFNFRMMTILPPLMLFLALRSYSVSRNLSLVLSLGFLLSAANFPIVPKVSHFALMLLLGGFFLSGFFSDRRLQTCMLMIAALLASYVRPEFFFAFISLNIILVLVTLGMLRSARSFRSTIPLVAVLLPCIILIFCLGLPMGSGNRSMVAFGQHYAINWVGWHNDERNPWTNWETIVKGDFGDVDTPVEAMTRNPSAVARHIVQNLQTLTNVFKSISGSAFPRRYALYIASMFGILLIVATVMFYIRGLRLTVLKIHFLENWASLQFSLLLLIIVLMPVALSILLIYPRPHYLCILGVVLAFGLAIVLFRNTQKDSTDIRSSSYILAFICIASLLTVRPLDESIKAIPQPNLTTIRFLRSLEITAPINILEAEGGYHIYAGKNYTRIAEYSKNSLFKKFLREKSINMIIVSDRLLNDTRFRDDPEWHSFTNNPSYFGFMKIDMPDNESLSLYVRE